VIGYQPIIAELINDSLVSNVMGDYLLDIVSLPDIVRAAFAVECGARRELLAWGLMSRPA